MTFCAARCSGISTTRRTNRASIARLRGLDQIDKAIVIDQSAIGRTPRSNPDHLHRRVHADSRTFRSAAGGAGARLRCRAFQFQRQRRALRKLRGRRLDQNRDAFLAGRLCRMRSLPGTALQSRDAGDHLQRKKHRRRARYDGGRSGAVFPQRAERSRTN